MSTSSHNAANAPSQDSAFLRVAHASPDAPAVNVTLDGETVLTNVSFGTVSDYLRVPAGEYPVTITQAGEPGRTVFQGSVSLEARTVSTLAASGVLTFGSEQAFAPVTFSDDAFHPPSNESAIRVAHLSPDAGAVDVVATEMAGPPGNGTGEPANATPSPPAQSGEPVVLASNVSFREASDYVNVPAGNYSVEIRAAAPDNDGPTLATVNVSLDSGTVYSAMALGFADPDRFGESFQVVLAQDAATSVRLPSVETPGNMTETPGNATDIPGNATETPEEETETPGAETETPTPTET